MKTRLFVTIIISLAIFSIAYSTHIGGTVHPPAANIPGHSFDDLEKGTLTFGSGDSLVLSGGVLRLVSGASDGLVLTSDDSGNITWQPLPPTTITGGTCNPGDVVSRINSNGTISCIPPGSFTGGTCSSGQVVQSISSAGAFNCVPIVLFTAPKTCSPGQVVTKVTPTLVTCENVITPKSCLGGQAVTAISSSGVVTCSTVTGDNLGNHNATQNLSMGTRRIINLTNPSTSNGDATTRGFVISRYQDRLTQNCPTGQVISKINDNGSVQCVPDATVITPYCLRSGLKVSPGYKCIDVSACYFNGGGNNSVRLCNSNGTWSDRSESTAQKTCPYFFPCGTTTTGSS